MNEHISIETIKQAEQQRIMDVFRWAVAAYDGDIERISRHCLGMSWQMIQRLRQDELEQVARDTAVAERERWVQECTKRARRFRSTDRRGFSPVAVWCANVLEDLREDMEKETGDE